jgi:hypothetical protein
LIINGLAGRMKTEDGGLKMAKSRPRTMGHGPKESADSVGFAGVRRRSPRQVEAARPPACGMVFLSITTASLAEAEKGRDVAATPKCGVNAKALRV